MTTISSSNHLVRYIKLVQGPGKLELLLLRAHLLAEEYLRALIDKSLQSPEHFSHKAFGFNQCLILAKSMYWKEGNEWIWECLKLLNTARNSMAHKLQTQEDQSVKKILDRLDLLIGKHSSIPMPSKLGPSVQRMHWRLASLYASMNRLI